MTLNQNYNNSFLEMVVTFYLRGLEWVDLLHNSHHPSPLLLTQTQIHYEEKHQPLLHLTRVWTLTCEAAVIPASCLFRLYVVGFSRSW